MADLEEEILPLNVTESIADEDSVTGKILYYAFPFRRQWQNEDYGKWQAALEFTCLLLSVCEWCFSFFFESDSVYLH